MKTLTLIVPRLDPLREASSADGASRWPQLARLAGRGSLTKRRLDASRSSSQSAVLDSLELRDVADKYPGAAVLRTGLSGERATGFWLRAQPIHFAAGLDRLTTVVLRGDARMNASERTLLSPVFAEHLQSTGFELHPGTDDEWLLRSDEPLQVQTVSPEFAAANPLAEILPRGRDAGGLRRLMTEMQMLLHEHPVNLQRQARGLPMLNAIWMHGEGTLREGILSDVTAGSLPEAYGDDVYLRGVYRLHQKAVNAKPIDAATLLAQVHAPTVAAIDVPDLDTLERHWLVPLNSALLSGTIARLTVMFDEWQVTATRAGMFKFWRGERQPMEWAAC